MKPQTTDEQRGMILSILSDMAESDQIADYIRHVGFDIGAIAQVKELPDAWVAQYWVGQGTYDVDRACMDLLTFPPISRRVFEMQGGLAK